MLAEASFELGHARLELSQLLLLLAHEREQGLHEVTHGEGGQAALVSGYCRRWCGVVQVDSMSAEGAVVKLVRFTGSRNGPVNGYRSLVGIGPVHLPPLQPQVLPKPPRLPMAFIGPKIPRGRPRACLGSIGLSLRPSAGVRPSQRRQQPPSR